MSNLQQQYLYCQKIHQKLPEVKAKYGLKFEVESDYYVAEDNKIYQNYMLPFNGETGDAEINFYPAIQAPQIRQILVGLQEVLDSFNQIFIGKECIYNITFADKTATLTIDDRWLRPYIKQANPYLTLKDYGLPLFDTNPETVLQELDQILENLLK